MRLRDQLIGAGLLIGATGFGLYRIAEAKNETTVGGAVFRLDDARVPELWVAPKLGPDRWAVFVESLRLVRRIYVRREALLDPVAHLYRVPRADIPKREAWEWGIDSAILSAQKARDIAT
jgi:hypothetical protein